MTNDATDQPEYSGGASLIGLIPDLERDATRILDFGCGNGDTLMRLKTEWGWRELYGIDIRESYAELLKEKLDGSWIMDIGDETTDLDNQYLSYFSYILMLDVVEHLYDPWYVIPKLAKFLSPTGKIIMSVPNLRHWTLWYNIILGKFPYGEPGGIMNEEHIRWFTFEGLQELVRLSGLQIATARLTFPPNVDLELMNARQKSPIRELVIPPPEVHPKQIHSIIKFPNVNEIGNAYKQFLANKLVFVCTKSAEQVTPVRVSAGNLEPRRKQLESMRKELL